MWNRLHAQQHTALITYLPAGFPDRATSLEALRTAAQHSDIIEVGVPFSDPVADGPVIQRASSAALARGASLEATLTLIEQAAVEVPVVLFTYLNPVLRFGIERMLAECGRIGIGGLLLTDLPAGADPGLEATIAAADIDLIRLVAPTTRGTRLERAVADASGFIYLVARMGVTGARADLDAGLADSVARVRDVTNLPIAVGFGVSTPEQVAEVATIADGVVVGSAAVAALERGGVGTLNTFLSGLRNGLEQP